MVPLTRLRDRPISRFSASGRRLRWPVRVALLLGAWACALLPAQQFYDVNVGTDGGDFFGGSGSGTSGDLRYCLSQARNYNPGGRPNIVIRIQTDVTLTKVLPPHVPVVAGDLTITGPALRTISGGNVARIFFFDAPNSSIVISNLRLFNGKAKGGDGKEGGGGGAGMGGAVFAAAGNVSLVNVQLSGNQAVGGAGGSFSVSPGAGGGGGLGGDGGTADQQIGLSPGGGGGGYYGAGGTSEGSGGSGGGGGGVRTDGSPGSSGLGGGGGGTTPAGVDGVRNAGAGGGSGGDNSSFGSSHDPFVPGRNAIGFGGAGGGGGHGGYAPAGIATGGNGNTYGGGGGGGIGPFGQQQGRGGDGGDYGGGGGHGGTGGFGGGAGAFGLPGFGGGVGGSVFPSQPGGAGQALGGNFFVRENVTLSSNVSIPNGSLSSSAGVAGAAAYVHTNGTLLFNPTDAYVSVGDVAGGGGVTYAGPANGVLDFLGNYSYSGPTNIQQGTLRLSGTPPGNSPLTLFPNGALDLYGRPAMLAANRLAAGTGVITNNHPGTAATLTVDSSSGNGQFDGRMLNGTSVLALSKIGANQLRLTGSSLYTGGTTVTGGVLELAGGDVAGRGTIRGDLTVTNATVRATVTNAFGYLPNLKVDNVTLTNSTLEHTASADQGWGVRYVLQGSVMRSNTSDSSSCFSMGLGDTVPSFKVSGMANSEIQGRVDLRSDGGLAQLDFEVDAGRTLLVSAAVTSSRQGVALRKIGDGQLTLANVNTYAGATIVDGGKLALNASLPAGVGVVRGTIQINSGATLETTVADAIGYLPGLKVNRIEINGGTLDNISASNVGWGVKYVLAGGTMKSRDSAAVQTSNLASFSFGGPSGDPTAVDANDDTTSSILGRVNLRAENGNNDTTFTIGNGAVVNVGAVVMGAGGIIKAGPGILSLGGTNTFTGPVRLHAGALELNTPAALNGNPLTFAGGRLRYANNTQDVSGSLAATAGSAYAVEVVGAEVTWQASLANAAGLTKSGPGVLRLYGSNPGLGGTTTLTDGLLAVNGPAALGSTRLTFAGGGVRWDNTTVDFSDRFNFTGPGPLILDTNNQAVTFNTALGGSPGLTKLGAGTLSLSQPGTLAGTSTLVGGVLELSSALALGTSQIVFAGGTLRYNGINTDFSDRMSQGGGPYLIDTNDQTVTYANGLAGGSGLRKIGAGRLILAGFNSYGGNTLVDVDGELQLGNGGTGGAIASFICQNDGGIIYQRTDPAQSFPILGGLGSLVLNGPGTLRVDNGNNFFGPTTINGGALSLEGSFHARGLVPGLITVNAGGVLQLKGRNVFYGNGLSQTKVTLNGGLLENTDLQLNTIHQLELRGGTLRSHGGNATDFTAFHLAGSVEVRGSAPSTLTGDTSLSPYNYLAIGDHTAGGPTTFDVDNVTGDAAADLVVEVSLVNGFAADGQPVAGGLRKIGPGTLRLQQPNVHSGLTQVMAGTLALGASNGLDTAAGDIFVAAGATLQLAPPQVGGHLNIQSGRTLTNFGTVSGELDLAGTYQGGGTVNGSIFNSGLVLIDGGTFTVTGFLENNRILRFRGGATFNAAGATVGFTNNGLIDLLLAGSGSTLPPSFSNGPNGRVLTPENLRFRSVAKNGPTVDLQIDGYESHTYQLQSAPSAAGPFVNVGTPVPGQGQISPIPITFSDSAATGAEKFYRVVVN